MNPILCTRKVARPVTSGGICLSRETVRNLQHWSGAGRIQADAALIGGFSYIGAVGAAALAAASQSPLVHETVIAASTGSISGLLGVLGVLLVRRLRKAH